MALEVPEFLGRLVVESFPKLLGNDGQVSKGLDRLHLRQQQIPVDHLGKPELRILVHKVLYGCQRLFDPTTLSQIQDLHEPRFMAVQNRLPDQFMCIRLSAEKQ